KLIPLCILNILHEKPLPIYGDGKYTRDWLYVVDHARGIDLVYHEGQNGQSYNIGGFNEWQNIDLVHELCRQMDQKLGRPDGTAAQLITYVKDRPGHDLRYAIDATKINTELGYEPSVTFEEGLSHTIDWFLENREWLERVNSGAYQDYYHEQYKDQYEMKVTETKLAGCFIIEPTKLGDSRGYFFESFNERTFQEQTGSAARFVQDNQSFSTRGVLRGLHAQRGEYAQA